MKDNVVSREVCFHWNGKTALLKCRPKSGVAIDTMCTSCSRLLFP